MSEGFSINSNVDRETPLAERLRAAARAGFSAVHWCEDLGDAAGYSPAQVEAMAARLSEAGLAFRSMHSPFAAVPDLQSPDPAGRARAVALVRNRLAATAELGGHCLVIHSVEGHREAMPHLADSLDRLADDCVTRGVVLAVEAQEEADAAPLFERFPASVAGFCFDSGHCNLQTPKTLSLLRTFRDRLCELHLHDNYGKDDDHRLPYDGTVDWPFIAGILASRNAGPALNLEVSRLTYAQGLYDPAETRLSLDSFLAEAYKRAARLARERNARWADARSAQGRDS